MNLMDFICQFSAVCDKKSGHFRLPEIEKEDEFWNFITNFFEYLECCENLFSNKLLSGPCAKCQNFEVPVKKSELKY